MSRYRRILRGSASTLVAWVAIGSLTWGQVDPGRLGTVAATDAVAPDTAVLEVLSWEANGPVQARLSLPGGGDVVEGRVEARTIAAARWKETYVDRDGRIHGQLTMPTMGGLEQTFDVSYLSGQAGIDLEFSPSGDPSRSIRVLVVGVAGGRAEFCWICVAGGAAVLVALCAYMEERAVANCAQSASDACGFGNLDEWSYKGGICGVGGTCRSKCKKN